MNAINERSFTKVVVASVVAVTAVDVVVGSMVGRTLMWRTEFNDGSFHVITVDRCKSVGRADER